MTETKQEKGGIARSEKLTPAQRTEIARDAAAARWGKNSQIPRATHGSQDNPLRIGEIEIDCYVLENGLRVVSQRGLFKAIGFSRGGARVETEAEALIELPRFATQQWVKPFLGEKIEGTLKTPIEFKAGSSKTFGYPATVLADICDSVLEARKQGRTTPRQEPIVERCETLVRGFARVGIIALVDEATGYQAERERNELHRILETYLSEERLAWAKRFPDEFYKQIYRLKGWKWPNFGKRTPLVGRITNSIVYELLPDGVIDELKRRNPTLAHSGRRQHKHHQFLSSDLGQPDLRDHLLQLIAVMRISKTWAEFEKHLTSAFPKRHQQLALEVLNEGPN